MLWHCITLFLDKKKFAPAARQEFFKQDENIKKI